MPLALDYSFVDTDREVLVTLPLKVAPGAVHVDVTRCSLKVNQTPYLLQLDLHGDVEWEAAATTVDPATRQVRVVLKKAVKGRWPAIRFSGPADAAAARRAAAEEEAAKRREELSAARQSTKAKLERAAVTAQLVVDEDARRTMDRAKADMHTAAEAEVFATFEALAKGEAASPPPPSSAATSTAAAAAAVTADSTVSATTSAAPKSAASAQPKRSVRFADDSSTNSADTASPASSTVPAPSAAGPAGSGQAPKAAAGVVAMSAATPAPGATSGRVDAPAAATRSSASAASATTGAVASGSRGTGSDIFADAPAAGEVAAVPPPRRELPPPRTRLAAAPPQSAPATAGSAAAAAAAAGGVSVPLTFTPRVFPTPARESQAAQEDEWLRRNRSYLERKRASAGTDASANSGEVVAARVRAREMYASGDFKGAHYAYGAVVEGTATAGASGPGLTAEAATDMAAAQTGALAARMRAGMFEGLAKHLEDVPVHGPAAGDSSSAASTNGGAIVRALAAWHTRDLTSAEAALTGAIAGGGTAAATAPADAAACVALGTALLDVLAAERATAAMKAVADAAARSGDRNKALAWYTVAHGVTPSHLPTLSNLGAVAFTAQHHDASHDISSHSRRVVMPAGGAVPPVTESAWLPSHGAAVASGLGARDWDAAAAAAQDAKFAARMAAAQRALAAASS